MKTLLPAVLITLFAISCNKKTESTVNTLDSSGVFVDTESVADSTLATTTGCYMHVTGNDTLFAQIDDNLGTVTGKLHYKNFQKDSSFGDLLGSSIGDTVKVDYTFQSEGVISTREIWFLKKDGKLYEGIGDFDKSGERYANYKKIKFEDGHVLSAVNCNTIANKFPEFSVSSSTPSASEPQKEVSTESKPETKEETKPAAKQLEKAESKPVEKTKKTEAKKVVSTPTDPKKK